MAEPRDDLQRPHRYDETEHPNNPPNAILSKSTRRRALWSYLGPIIVLFIIMGLGLVYWARREASPTNPATEQTYAVGTTGGSLTENGYKPNSTPGGDDPGHVLRPGSPQADLERRGANGQSQGPNPPLYTNQPLTKLDAVLQKPKDVAGRPVDLKNVTVDSAQGNRFWARDDDMKVEVIGPADMTALRAGMRVHVIGAVEDDGSGRSRIRASRVEVTK